MSNMYIFCKNSKIFRKAAPKNMSVRFCVCNYVKKALYVFLLTQIIEENNNDKSLGHRKFIPDLKSVGKNRFTTSSIVQD